VNAGALAVRVEEGAVLVALVLAVALCVLVVELLAAVVVLDCSGALATETVLVEDPPQPPASAAHTPIASTPALAAIRLVVVRGPIAYRIFAALHTPPG
jgi:hypothetical protein